MMQVSKRYFF